MTTPKPCESGACIHVHEEGGIVHIRSTETGDSMTATPAEWSDYLAKVRRDELNVSIQAAERVAELEAQRNEVLELCAAADRRMGTITEKALTSLIRDVYEGKEPS